MLHRGSLSLTSENIDPFHETNALEMGQPICHRPQCNLVGSLCITQRRPPTRTNRYYLTLPRAFVHVKSKAQRSKDARALLVCTVETPSALLPSPPSQYTLPDTVPRDVVWLTTRRRPLPNGSAGRVSLTAGRLFDVDTSYVPSYAGCITTDAAPFDVRASDTRRAPDGASSYCSLIAPLLERAVTTKLPPEPDSVVSETDEVIWLCV